MKRIEDYVISIPDFPEPGIIFRDVTSVLQDADGLRLAIDLMQEKLKGLEFDLIAGSESRGDQLAHGAVAGKHDQQCVGYQHCVATSGGS